MLDFKLEYYFTKYKDTSIISIRKFKEDFIKENGEFQLINELIIMIQKYQIKKYGCMLENGKNIYDITLKEKRNKKELQRNRNRFGTKEERELRRIRYK